MTVFAKTAGKTKILVDADILIKLSVLDCFVDCLAAIGLGVDEAATLYSMVLSAGMRKRDVRVRKARTNAGANRLLKTLRTVATIDQFDKTERQLAASLVGASQQLGLAVDGGEAILISVCVNRSIPLLTTGDKRAIRSLPAICGSVPQVANLNHKIIPFEYLLLKLTQAAGFSALLPKLNGGACCDGALSQALTAAGCNQAVFETELGKRLSQLRKVAGQFLCH